MSGVAKFDRSPLGAKTSPKQSPGGSRLAPLDRGASGKGPQPSAVTMATQAPAPAATPAPAPATAATPAPSSRSGMSESKFSGSMRDPLRQTKEMFKTMNGNIFQVMNGMTSREETVKDLSKYHDRKPMMYGSIALISYITISTLIYCVGFEWRFVDALYFVVVTLTTVGYGDHEALDQGEKAVTIFVVFIGVGLIGAALGIVASTLLDKADDLDAMFDKASSHVSRSTANLIVSLLLIVVMLVIGACAFKGLVDEDDAYTWLDAFYFAAVTVTTVGYGDISWAANERAQMFGIFYLIFGTILIAKALSDIASVPLERRKAKLEAKVLEQYGEGLSLEELQEITNGTEKGFCTKNEFILLMLHKLNKVDPNDIDAAVKQFEKLDIDKSGILTTADVESQVKISQARNNAADILVGVGAFDDALEKNRKKPVKKNAVAPAPTTENV